MPPKSRAAKAKANGTEDVSPAPSALGKRPRTGIAEGSQTAVPPPDPDVASAIVEADDQREEPPVKKKRKKKGSSQAAAGAGIARGASTTAKAALSSSKKPLATAPAPKRKLSRELDGLKDGRSEPDASAYGRDSSDTEGKRRSKRLNKAVPPASNVQQLPLPVIVEEEEQEENGPSIRSANGGQQAPLAQNSHDLGSVIEGDVDDQPQDPVSRGATSPRSTPSSNRRDKEGLDASREDLRNFRPAAPIDFSTIDVEEIYRNFAPYGGGRLQPHSSEKEVRERYERENPSVRYTDSNQIPPDPREPKDPSDGDGDRGLKLFAPIEPKYAVRARTNDAKARWHDDGWDTVWSTLRAHNPPDRIYEMYDYCWRDSCQLRDRAYFADIPDWPAGTLPSAFFPQVRRAVEVAMMESLVPQWKEQIVLTGQQFGDAGARDLEQKLAAMKNGVVNGTKRPDIPRDNDMFEAEWAGRLQQFAQGSLGPLRESTRRTQHRLKAAHRRALKIRSDYDIRVRPPILNDGVIHTSMEHYCNRLHVILRQTLIDYIKPVWPPAPRSPRTTDRYNRMVYRVVQGQNPYPPGQASPKELDFVDIATKEIGFDHVRSQQDPGRWEYREHLGSGSFGQVGVWVCYNEFGKIIDRLAIKDTYLASTKGLGFNAWKQAGCWYKDKNDKIPKEYAALAMLNSCESSGNIVHCRAYSVYDERGMYRLYTEYCGHNDLEYTIDRYRTLAMLNADMAAIDGTRPEQARIPDRVLWCIIEALSSAACLMDLGYIPTGDPDTDTPPPNFQQMLHRDIKPLNIFLSTPRSDNHWPKIPTPKLGDFGGVIFCDEPEAPTQIYGTRCYTSPEVLRRGIPHPITPKADIWAIGRVMLSLINLNFQDDHELLSRESEVDFVKTPDFKAGAEEGRHPLLCELIRNCLNPLPADRPTAKELWMRVWREVGVEEPMTRIRWEEDEMLMFESDKYEAFAS